MRITGLDLSLTSTGVASVSTSDPVSVEVQRLRPPKSLNAHERLAWLLERLGRICSDSTWVLVEGPSFGSPNAQHKLGGLWWLVAHGLWRLGVHYDVVTPGQLKTYATGRGVAEKDEVLAEVIRRYPDVEVRGNDIADALVLAALGCDYLGHPLAKLPKEYRRALEMVNWTPQAQEWRRLMVGE